jgi:hypothetical protein
VLTAEAMAVNLLVAQCPPEQTLSIRHITS